ncbi:hypothetical protein J7T55_010675 [Diaporthe amygdali]|uniref:uncharacterized protein n=1 Tax=Phomopsis amygdali TaxID=1214568 RepID=UPI0022FE0F59|nr:uncharacterized protein J7T55_010675 [Diaporthe amygdali]KAJ0114286.1 hypothetical protein J7T55_010675 [Diaporthe amygdali]
MSRRFLKNLLPSKSKSSEISEPMGSTSLVAKLTQKQLEEYKPKSQPCYSFSGTKWQRGRPPAAQEASGANEGAKISNLRLLTWNIDFMAPFPQARMASALSYLQTLVEDIPASTAVIICLQELRQDMPINFDRLEKSFDPQIADDLRQIASASWIQNKFLVTDLTTDYWRCGYNSVTLVDKRLSIAEVSRLPFVSEYKREALLVDIAVRTVREQAEGDAESRHSILRLCNVHLDSMAGKPPMRPIQWKACAKYLQDESDGVVCGILAGDCNANQGYDLTQPEENGFKDAYLEMGGKEDDPEGHTWGPQSKSSRFPHKRMDKVCFWQRNRAEDQPIVQLKSVEKIGVGIRVEDKAISEKLDEEGWMDFVTDHHGLMVEFEVGEAWALDTQA